MSWIWETANAALSFRSLVDIEAAFRNANGFSPAIDELEVASARN